MRSLTTLDPVYTAYCEQFKSAPKVYDGSISVAQLRKSADEKSKNNIKNLPDVIEEDKRVVCNGIEIRLTLYRPPGTENEVLPIVIFYHGGGYVLCSKYTHAKPVRDVRLFVYIKLFVSLYNHIILILNKFYPFHYLRFASKTVWQ